MRCHVRAHCAFLLLHQQVSLNSCRRNNCDRTQRTEKSARSGKVPGTALSVLAKLIFGRELLYGGVQHKLEMKNKVQHLSHNVPKGILAKRRAKRSAGGGAPFFQNVARPAAERAHYTKY